MSNSWRITLFVTALGLVATQSSVGQVSFPRSPTNLQTTANPAQLTNSPPPSYYQEPPSSAAAHDPDPPRYVRRLGGSGMDPFKELFWLDLGLDYRFRYEFRNHDLRRAEAGLDQPLLHRTRAYLGLKEIADPFRCAVELTDSRRYHSAFVRDNRDVNEFEPTMFYGELYLASALGHDPLGNARPLSVRAGRMNFEFLDRRLLGNNQWRNTPNTFDGLRTTLGRDANDWQFDLLAIRPNHRLKYDVDEPVAGQWLLGAIGHWRGWSDHITVEPYYLHLRQAATGPSRNQPAASLKREVHSHALRAYGRVGQTGLDYDCDAVWQFGRQDTATGSEATRAFGLTTEVGYTFPHAWKPRLSVFYGYASGDVAPNDNRNERFERFYGFARPWSANDYIVWENISTPKVRLEFQPHKDIRADVGHSFYWLASATDRMNNLRAAGAPDTPYRDPTGRSGTFVGHEFDACLRHQVTRRTEVTAGFSHFFTERFARSAGKRDSDFFYLEIRVNAF